MTSTEARIAALEAALAKAEERESAAAPVPVPIPSRADETHPAAQGGAPCLHDGRRRRSEAHSVLAYYYDHRPELDAELERRRRHADESRAELEDAGLRERLREGCERWRGGSRSP